MHKNINLKENKLQNIIVLCVVLGLGILFHYQYITDYPNYIHAWTQADRYALALGFFNNNFNLFYPESYLYNPQFSIACPTTISAVDFPIHEFIIAGMMKLFGTTSPWVFRCYTLLYSILGLYFLFKLSVLLTKDFFKSLFVVIFVATSSVFVYYQGGFLPSIPSLSNVFIGMYFYILHIQKQQHYQFHLALLFFTLAALSRTSFLVPLVAVLCFEFLRIIRKEISIFPKILPVIVSFTAILAYFLWNKYLQNEYGTLFLSHFSMADDFQHAKEFVIESVNNWKYHYFSIIHYIILIFVAALALFFSIKNKENKKQESSLSLWLLIAIWLFGCLLFSIVMLWQFISHDYYFLDSYFFLIIFIFILLLSKVQIPHPERNTIISLFFIIIVSIPMITKAYNMQEERRNAYWEPTLETLHNFEKSSAFLDSLKIDKSAKMLSINAYPSNLSFVLMNRKGYFVPTLYSKTTLEEYLLWDYDYIVIPDDYYIYEYQKNPKTFSKLRKIAGNGKITIAELSDKPESFSVAKWLDLKEKNFLFHQIITFDTLICDNWKNTQFSEIVANSGTKAGVLEKGTQWGIAYRTKDTKLFSTSHRNVLFSGFFNLKNKEEISVVLSIEADTNVIYRKSYSIAEILQETNTWQKIDLLFLVPMLPSAKKENYEFILHVFSPEGCSENLYYDDIEIIVY